MAQLSRPFQIALAAVALLAAVWLFALRGHEPSAGGSEPGAAPAAAPTSPATSPTAKATGSTAQAPKLPGQKGLETAIDKAHGAVATSQRNAAELERKSSRASGEGASTSAAAPKHATSAPATPAKPAAPSTHMAAPKTSNAATAPALQRAVEGELARGDVVVLLFWDPRGADDQAVHAEVRSLHATKLAVHEAAPGEVAAFGTITRGVQVYGTPTILVVDRKGHTQVLTGLQDAYAIGQAIAEARRSS